MLTKADNCNIEDYYSLKFSLKFISRGSFVDRTEMF